MPLLYSAIAKGREVLVECNQSTKHVATGAAFQLRNVRQTWGRHTVNSEGYNYHFLFQGELAFLTVSEDSFHRSVAVGFLNKLRDDFVQKYGDKPVSPQTCKGFSSTMKQSMNYCNSHPEEFCKVAAVQKKVDEVKSVMAHNIDQVLERGEKLTVMVEKADDLQTQAKTFEKQSGNIVPPPWYKTWKVIFVILISLAVLAFVISSLICFSHNNCGPRPQPRLRPTEDFLLGAPPSPHFLSKNP